MRILLTFILSLFIFVANAQNEGSTTTAASAKTESTAKPEGGGEGAKPKAKSKPARARTSSASSGAPKVSRTYSGKRTRKEARGYRVQVYSAAGNTKTKLAAQEMAAKVKKLFPELSVYCRFKSPRWVCRVGDFATKSAAERYLAKIKKAKISSEVSIVIDDVFLPQ